MKEKLLDVAAIRNGIVIDHIPPGNALRLAFLCCGEDVRARMFIGLNLHSKKMKTKDLLKIENWKLTQDILDIMAVLGRYSLTVNMIENFEIISKFKPEIPMMVSGCFRCINEKCISRKEKIPGKFNVVSGNRLLDLLCFYCNKPYIIK